MPMLPVLPTHLTATLPTVVSALAAEPASILYIFTGAIAFAATGIRKARQATSADASSQSSQIVQASTAMLFCQSNSRESLKELKLF
jgi:hypothetical protein